MTENEAILKIKYRIDTATQVVGIGVDGKAYEDLEIAIKALEEIQQYRAIGTVEEFQHFITAWDELKILIDIAKNELSQYKSIGTVDEFKALKENERKCEDCAGCTNWKCDCANERDYAITQFANFLHEKAKENNGLRLSSEKRSWTHPSIFDYLEEFKSKQICEEEVEEISEQMKGGGKNG